MRSRPPVQAHDNIARTAAAERDIFIAFPPLSPALRADGRTKKDGAHTMTDQELRRLSRADLIDIIYTLQQQKEQILADAERQAKEIVDIAERQAAEHWKRFQLQAGQLIQAHAELQEMFKGMANQ